eukprot:CAMPEP_0117467178 /NCGR_PEP_ID=MMETSP0784-20121206/5520_1 /TAXON_ID=39447 /ORGANISM="" /LENGTH=267 /DNA_ID=CAMNT_0005261135 /DNA_START=134 /DNA_END=938 /DNA_ORIENTATION=-
MQLWKLVNRGLVSPPTTRRNLARGAASAIRACLCDCQLQRQLLRPVEVGVCCARVQVERTRDANRERKGLFSPRDDVDVLECDVILEEYGTHCNGDESGVHVSLMPPTTITPPVLDRHNPMICSSKCPATNASTTSQPRSSKPMMPDGAWERNKFVSFVWQPSHKRDPLFPRAAFPKRTTSSKKRPLMLDPSKYLTMYLHSFPEQLWHRGSSHDTHVKVLDWLGANGGSMWVPQSEPQDSHGNAVIDEPVSTMTDCIWPGVPTRTST